MFAFIVVCCFIAYVLFQARFILAGPQISLSSEATPARTQRMVTLSGTASNIVRMTLNGRQIYTDSSGNFNEALVLENGYTIATLEAEDRYGRIKRLTETFVHVPSNDGVIN